uniref:Uncharacterized protein n=1 Tax=Anguilla anguilla TaxID=7936 RepID=A0A0E9XRX1_ANGAN
MTPLFINVGFRTDHFPKIKRNVYLKRSELGDTDILSRFRRLGISHMDLASPLL